jgi:phage tail sheath protein FI
VPERMLDGIVIAETPTAEQPIARTHAQRTAFVGRTLRGPLDTPVLVRSFADFQQIFGGLWQPSPLSYAIEHFFEQGGRQAIIVRVANAAAPVTISLPCERATLQLEALAPGTREFLRASVDYDHIDADDAQRFNLVVQRVRSPGSERIEAQETFRAVSSDPADLRHVAKALSESTMVRVRGQVPLTRPNATLLPGTKLPVGYVSSNPDGDDGKPLTDYDIIGSMPRRTGLFALRGVEDVAFIYIPPLARTTDVGVSILLAAERFCREQRAILIVDPPTGWDSPTAAINGLKALGFYSDSATMFYPRIECMDRLRARIEVFGSGGAAAGILSRTGEFSPAAANVPEPELLLRAGARLHRELTSVDRARLATYGLNSLQSVRSTERKRPLLRTLACGASAHADWAYLMPRRFALFVIDAIERGTRWSIVERRNISVWFRLAHQITQFFTELRAAGSFSAAPKDQAFLVICDERINEPSPDAAEINILVQFAANHIDSFHSFMITHTAAGSRVRPVVINRLEASLIVSSELEREITMRVEHGMGFMNVLVG